MRKVLTSLAAFGALALVATYAQADQADASKPVVVHHHHHHHHYHHHHMHHHGAAKAQPQK
jgi:hypothetical protein